MICAFYIQHTKSEHDVQTDTHLFVELLVLAEYGDNVLQV